MATNGHQTNSRGATVPFFIGGKEVVSEQTFDVVNPATGKVVHQCSGASSADARAASDAAAAALPAWRDLPPPKRRDIFLKAADVFERRRDELATTMVEELGMPRGWAEFNIGLAREFALDLAGRLVTIEGVIPTTQDPKTGAMVIKEPFGVVLAIAPW